MKEKKNQRAFATVFLLAVAFLTARPELQASSADEEKYGAIVKQVAANHGIDPSLVHSIIRTESDFNPWAVSSKGAAGLMQLMPETARSYGVRNLFDPHENIKGGVMYLRDLMRVFDSRTDLVLAAYNAGLTAVQKYGGIPPYPETIRFVEKVMTNYPRSTISPGRKIYKFRDSSGRVVFTNNPFLVTQADAARNDNPQ